LVFGKMGLLRVRQCRFPEAQSLYDHALILAREVGSRPLEGVVLGGLGDLQARLRQFGDGLAALRAGENTPAGSLRPGGTLQSFSAFEDALT
jgi:hypothetical protein